MRARQAGFGVYTEAIFRAQTLKFTREVLDKTVTPKANTVKIQKRACYELVILKKPIKQILKAEKNGNSER